MYAVFRGKRQITCAMSYGECERYLMGEPFPEKLKIRRVK